MHFFRISVRMNAEQCCPRPAFRRNLCALSGAAEDCQITFLNLSLLSDSRYSHASWHPKLQSDLLYIFARKNLTLSSRIFCTTPKTIRERLLTYLSGVSLKAGSSTFQIPFDRQQLADYLNLDRSALSKELGKMQQDGLIEYHKNTVILKHDEF